MEYEKYDKLGWFKNYNLEQFELNYQGWGRDFDHLVAEAEGENMPTLTRERMHEHLFGIGRYGMLFQSRSTTFEPFTYAGISEVVEIDGKPLAVIEGLVVASQVRGQGKGFATARKLLQYASKPTVQNELGHEGYVVKANLGCKGIFTKLGLATVEDADGQYTLVGPLVQ